MSAPPPATKEKDTISWRKDVSQSYRSSEIREISKVLAALEPGATSASKLMLATRFEDAIFQSSNSLPDYRKRLAKRLKKLQKSYVPAKATDKSKDGKSSSLGGTAVENKEELLKEEKRMEAHLREKYGEALTYTVKNARTAIEAIRSKHGAERAEHLKQHTDNAEQWACDIGLFSSPDEKKLVRRRRMPRDPGYLKNVLSIHLRQRVDNIRRHVVNLTNPDQFLEETLVKLEDEMTESTSRELASRAHTILQSKTGQGPPAKDKVGLKLFMERAALVVPPIRKNQPEDIKEASLDYLNKIKAAAQVIVSYVALDPTQKVEFKGVLKKAHGAAVEGIQHLIDNYSGAEDLTDQEIVLEDAWNKVIKYVPTNGTNSNIAPIDTIMEDKIMEEPEPPSAKRRKLSEQHPENNHAMVIKTRVLLSKGRKAPYSLISELKKKNALFFQHNGTGAGARVRMKFGTAFEMTVFFSPLIVTLRAFSPLNAKGIISTNNTNKTDQEGKTLFQRTVIDNSLPTWTPSTSCLFKHNTISVSGVTGPSSAMGHFAARKLEYASFKATWILRKCFADISYDSSCTTGGTKSDVEIEILEATALLRFLNLARETYLN